MTLCASDPAEAAHSRKADMVISRPMMTTTGTVMALQLIGRGGSVDSRISAVATLDIRFIESSPLSRIAFGTRT